MVFEAHNIIVWLISVLSNYVFLASQNFPRQSPHFTIFLKQTFSVRQYSTAYAWGSQEG